MTYVAPSLSSPDPEDRADGLADPLMVDLTLDVGQPLASRERAELFERVSELCSLGTPFTLHLVSAADEDVNVVNALAGTNAPMSAYTRASRVLLYHSRGVSTV